MKRFCVINFLLLFFAFSMNAQVAGNAVQTKASRQTLRESRPEFFQTEEARRIGDQLLLFQRVTGGWPKNLNMVDELTEEGISNVTKQKDRRDDSTIDNDATTMQMYFLARLYQATHDNKYRDAFRKGAEYILSGQYKNGGWPQFWPENHGYQVHITFNDDAMVHAMSILRAICEMEYPFQGELTDAKLRTRCQKAFDKGIECILDCQIVDKNGNLTIWCQQHDHETLKPAAARAYELPSYCSQESTTLINLLMSLPNPSDRVKKSINAAMKWLDSYKIMGYTLKRGTTADGQKNTELLEDDNAKALWARFYDLENTEPYVCDRDGLPRRRLEDIGIERRSGYSWFNSNPAKLYATYNAWADRYDREHKVRINIKGAGANETGKIHLFAQPTVNEKLYDVIVKPRESIQKAIDAAPNNATMEKPYKILVKKGLYREKLIIDKPNIVLVGETRDSTLILGQETDTELMVAEHNGVKAHQGIIYLTEKATDCVISGLTINNNYGTTVYPTTATQNAIYCAATRLIILNCNVNSDGNETLALAAKSGGLYYNADVYVRTGGIDGFRPNGTCFITRSQFYGDGRSLVLHDGHNSIEEKVVITNCRFDARRVTPLGRFRHDSQFFFVNCSLTENIQNQDIDHAYKTTKKDSDRAAADGCQWGRRVYYGRCSRIGGNSGWLEQNLSDAPGAPEHYQITAHWTFGSKWDPELRVRDLWEALAY